MIVPTASKIGHFITNCVRTYLLSTYVYLGNRTIHWRAGYNLNSKSNRSRDNLSALLSLYFKIKHKMASFRIRNEKLSWIIFKLQKYVWLPRLLELLVSCGWVCSVSRPVASERGILVTRKGISWHSQRRMSAHYFCGTKPQVSKVTFPSVLPWKHLSHVFNRARV